MSRLRTTVSRLLALGGLTAVSGSSLALYRYSLLGDNAECRSSTHNASTFKDTDAVVKETVAKEWDDDWDRRKPRFNKNVQEDNKEPSITIVEKNGSTTNIPVTPPPEVPKSTATRHVILVRHGQYELASDQDINRVLTEIGRQQAAVTGERLKSLNIKFDKITVSTMTRAQQTASIISECIPDVPQSECSLLREGAPYPPEPSSSAWKPQRWRFYQDNPRIEGAFRKYIHRAPPSQKEDSYDLIVCHGNVIRYFVCRALQFPPEGWLRMSVGHCGLTWLTIRPNGRVSMRGLGDTGHLPPDLVTFS